MKAMILAVLAGLCWGVGEVLAKSALSSGKIGPVTAAALRTTAALPVLWGIAWIALKVAKVEPSNWTHAPSPVLAKVILGSGVLATAGGVTFFFMALSIGEISRVKPIAFSVAVVVAVLLGTMMLHESLTALKIAGTVMLIGGILLLTI